MKNLSDSSCDLSIEYEKVVLLNDAADWELNPEDDKNHWNKVGLQYLVYPPNISRNTKKTYKKKLDINNPYYLNGFRKHIIKEKT